MSCSTPRSRPASTDGGPPRRGPERGTALVLVPVMTLVLLCLGAIAVDLSLVHAMHRDTHRVASVAADDAAAMIDERRLQIAGELVVDRRRAERVVRAHVASAQLAGEVVALEVSTTATAVDVQVTVE